MAVRLNSVLPPVSRGRTGERGCRTGVDFAATKSEWAQDIAGQCHSLFRGKVEDEAQGRPHPGP